MSVSTERFLEGQKNQDIFLYTITNTNGMKAQITNFGATLVSLLVPDKDGKLEDVVLGYDNVMGYFENKPFFGATIGRHANRIEQSCFELNSVIYKLEANDNNNHLHGGSKGFHKVIWKKAAMCEEEGNWITLSYLSKDGESNYPGNLKVEVTYSIDDNNSLNIDYFAVSDKDTVVNLTNHTYFNLSSTRTNDILDHEVAIYANSYTAINQECIPTGEICDVHGTPLDFTHMKPIRSDIFSDNTQIINGNGFDHNWVLNAKGDITKKAAEAYDPLSGRKVEVYTTKPGIQFYSGNCIASQYVGKYNIIYKPRSGFCFETQYFPNALKHKNFPSPVLKAGEQYRHKTIYKFV